MAAKKKLLFYVPDLGGGGAEHMLVNQLHGLQGEDVIIDLVTLRNEGVYSNQIPKAIRIFTVYPSRSLFGRIPCLSNLLFLYVRKMCMLLFRQRRLYQALVLRRTYDTEIYILPTKVTVGSSHPATRSKKIFWLHNDCDFPQSSSLPISRRLQAPSHMHTVVCISEQVKRSYITQGGDASKAVLYLNSVNADHIRKQALADAPAWRADTLHIMALGRMAIQKRYDRLLEAMAILHQDYPHLPPYQLHILGTGDMLVSLQMQCERLQLTQTVKFEGYIANPYPYLASADIFVMSSDHEGLPGAMLEARILTTPIVTTQVSGVEEILEHGKLGKVTALDPYALARALAEYLCSKDARKQAKELLYQHPWPYDLKTQIPKLRKIYGLDAQEKG